MKLCKVLLVSLLICSLPIISLADDGCPPNATRKKMAELEEMGKALAFNLVGLIHDETLKGRMYELKPSTHKVITDKKAAKIFGPSTTVRTYTALYGGDADAKALKAQYQEQLAKSEIEFPACNKTFVFKISASQIFIYESHDPKKLHRAVIIPAEVCFWGKSRGEQI